jgi:hypothetical protein
VFLFTSYEAWIEGLVAVLIVAAAVAGFVMHPRRELYYVRTTVRRISANRKQVSEPDVVAIKVELQRLWLLFLLAAGSEAILVFLVAGSPTKFSVMNWLFSSTGGLLPMTLYFYAALFVLVLLAAWVGESRVMRDAEACNARSFSISTETRGFGRVSYLFMGERGEYFGGSCLYFGWRGSRELATIVFRNVHSPEINKIAMGFLFHRFVVVGRGVRDPDKETVMVAQGILPDTSPS